MTTRQKLAPVPVQVPSVQGADQSWFETVYSDAAGDAAKVPWAKSGPNPLVISWLNAEAPGRIRPGARAVVVGCGLGDDVVELANRGYDVTGFDLSSSAVDWARQRFPGAACAFMVADLFNLPARLKRRFDLVIEANTIQAVGLDQRQAAVSAIASLSCPHGTVLCVCRGRDDATPVESFDGPPWPLSSVELVRLFEQAGMHPIRTPDDFEDDLSPPVRRVRAAFVHQ